VDLIDGTTLFQNVASEKLPSTFQAAELARLNDQPERQQEVIRESPGKIYTGKFGSHREESTRRGLMGIYHLVINNCC